MKAGLRQFGWLLLAVSYASAQTAPTNLIGVTVTPTAKGIQVDVSLSGSVQPSVLTTTNPDRLVLDFPNTTATAKQQRLVVSSDGVRGVRYGLHASTPPVMRLVVDLDNAHTYDLQRSGTHVRLTLAPSNAVASSNVRHGAQPAGRGGILLTLGRKPNSDQPPEVHEDLNRPIPEMPPDSQPAQTVAGSAQPAQGNSRGATVFPGPVATGGTAAAVTATQSTSTTGVPASSPSAPAPAQNIAVAAPAPQPAAAGKETTETPVNNQVPSVTVSVTSKAEETVEIAPQPPKTVAPVTTPKEVAATSSGAATSVSSPVATAATVPASSSTAAAGSPTVSPSNPTPAQTVAEVAQPAQPAVANKEAIAPAPANAGTTENAAQAPEAVAAGTEPGEPSPASPESTDQITAALAAADPNLKTVFKVKFVANGVAYLDGGRSAGLAEGMKLEVKETDLLVKQGTAANPKDPRVVAELSVTGVAETSAVTDVQANKRAVKEGDLAYLSDTDAQTLVQQRTLSPTREYPIVVAFSEGEPLDEEVRKELPRPPQPSVNRARGRIGFDYMGTASHGNPSSTNTDVGMVLRTDITRIGGSYWNLSGYWRGRLHSQSASNQDTLQDLINRTYHLGMFYDNPNSRWVAGAGRLYLPWAPSLDTIDGGYFGARLGGGATVGFFAGSTPDPTSWSYNPDRRISGTFINFEGGSYDAVHYTSTSGVGISALKWQIDRPFVFLENTLSYKRSFSIYDSLQADSPRANPEVPAPGPGLARNFLTIRMQVHPRVELDFNHNYLRDVPTYDPALVGTGLLDKYLFQGFSGGARVEVLKQVYVYTNLGSSNRSGDAKNSLNQLYGLTFARLPWWGLRADAHYSRFNSSFADGQYRSFSLGRNLTDALRLDVLVGDQTYTSALATSDRTRFINANFETSFGRRYFMQGGFTINRGQTQNYDQWLTTIGYRFDSRGKNW